MHYQFNLINHLQPIRAWANARGAQIGLDADTLSLTIVRASVRLRLLPRFMIRLDDGQIAYTQVFTSQCRFVGWLPYERKQWSLASDKVAFKAFCLSRGLRVPTTWSDKSSSDALFLLKPRRGSWGKGIRGPFRADDISTRGDVRSEGILAEAFVAGTPIKIWFWNEVPVAYETAHSPVLYGDGVKTLDQLALGRRGNFDIEVKLDGCEDMLAAQGYRRDSVPSRGTSVQLSYLFATPFDPIEVKDRNQLASLATPARAELFTIGARLVQAIPAEIRKNTLYTIDAVIDAAGMICILEMNCHPVIHPATYVELLKSYFTG